MLCWLSIIAHANVGQDEFVSIEDVVKAHWKEYGRNFFSRYDYEQVETDAANKVMAELDELMKRMNEGRKDEESMVMDEEFALKVAVADNFAYTDPVDGSVASAQGRRFVFDDGSRIIFRLSGTGSSGATIRLYVEKYEPDEAMQGVDAQEALKPLIDLALKVSKLSEFTGREKPTVIT